MTDAIKPLVSFSSALFLSYLLENSNSKALKLTSRFIQLSLSVLFMILFLLFMYYHGIGKNIEHQDIMAIMQTDPSEAFAYFYRHFLSLTSLLLALSTFLFSLFCFTGSGKALSTYINLLKPLHCAVLGICFLCFCVYATAKINTLKVIIHDISNYKLLLEEFHAIAHSDDIHDVKFTHTSRGEIHIVVIGESASRNFMQLYIGNPLLPKTEYIQNITAQKNSVLFQNAYAFTNATVGTLCSALSDGRALTGTTFPKGENIMSTARAAGFKTVWLSNQASVGEFENPISALAYHADETIYTNLSNIDNFTKTKLDEELLPIFEQVLQDRGKEENYIIFLHLMGSHSPYSSRVPEGKTSFDIQKRAQAGKLVERPKRLELFNMYLESLEYSDLIIGKLFEIAQSQKPNISSFTYFSDHGEDLFTLDGEHRIVEGATWSVMRVPFFVWLSDNYVARHPQKMQALANNKDKIFINDSLYDLILGLNGIVTSGYSAKFDISSDEYFLDVRNARTSLSEIKEEPYFMINETLSATQRQFKLGTFNVDSVFKGWILKSLNINFFGLNAKIIEDKLVLLDSHDIPFDLPIEEAISLLPANITLYMDISRISINDSDVLIKAIKKLPLNDFEVIVGSDDLELVSLIERSGLNASYIMKNNELISDLTSKVTHIARVTCTRDNYGLAIELAKNLDKTEIILIDSSISLDDKNLHAKLTRYFDGNIKYILIPFKSQYDAH